MTFQGGAAVVSGLHAEKNCWRRYVRMDESYQKDMTKAAQKSPKTQQTASRVMTSAF